MKSRSGLPTQRALSFSLTDDLGQSAFAGSVFPNANQSLAIQRTHTEFHGETVKILSLLDSR